MVSNQTADLELSRPVRPWEFIDAVGRQAGIFGHENGTVEMWAYPLEILHNFRLTFHSEQHVIPAESLARTVTVRPESTSVLYVSDSFSVRETYFIPLHEAGAVIALEIDAFAPVEVEASFERDFQLMWPAAIGGTWVQWDEKLHAFAMGVDGHPYFAVAGSPSATNAYAEYWSNYSSSRTNSFSLPKVEKTRTTYLIAIAASLTSQKDAEERYSRLLAHYRELRQESADYYRNYLAHTISVRLPDAQVEAAYNWARISLIQGLVENPYLGEGLVAGYRTSWNMRPGFAWFFGRDALWSSLALISTGDYSTARIALEFLRRKQRVDGKMPHEIPQTASLIPWFRDYPYGYDAADSTPLYIIAADDYVKSSGDLAFAAHNWDSLRRAFEFLHSTYGDWGWPRNVGIGYGWMESGPFVPMGSEIYLSGLAVQATQALADLARLTGHPDLSSKLQREFSELRTRLNQSFWSPEHNLFALGLNTEGKRVDVPSVLTAVPMWFGLLDSDKAQSMIDQLAGPDHSTDWGMRNGSDRQPQYDPAGYQFGSVWPLFTGWASVGEYRYHRPLPAYANLRSNALLTLNGALGRTVEALSGARYEPLAASCPHQIWSSAMVISPLLRGMMGLAVDSTAQMVRLAPDIPATWDHFEIRGVGAGGAELQFFYRRNNDGIELTVRRTGSGNTTVEFSPAISSRASVVTAEVNGKPVRFEVEQNGLDQHPLVRFPASAGKTVVELRVRDDFAIEASTDLPALGSTSENLKVIAENWNDSHDRLQILIGGIAGREYELRYRGATPATVAGGELDASTNRIYIRFPSSEAGEYERLDLVLGFTPE